MAKDGIKWLMGMGLTIVVGAGIGITANQRAKEVVPPQPPKPVTYVLPSRDAIESDLINPIAEAGYVVQKGDTWESIGNKLYPPKGAGKRLRSMNEYMGTTSEASETYISDPIVDVNGDGKITYWDFARRPKITWTVTYPFLGAGDTLFTPKYMTGFDGVSYEYSAHVSQAAIDRVYHDIRSHVIDSVGGKVDFKYDGPSGRRFDEEIGWNKVR